MSAVDSPSAGSTRWLLLLLLAVCGVVVTYLLAIWASAFLSRRPSIALVLNPHNPAALINRAEALFDADPPNLDGARRYAAAALQADPLNSRAHRILARIAADADDGQAADTLARLSARFARDGEAQFDVLKRAVAVENFNEAVHRLDMLYRGQPSALWTRIGQAFVGMIGNESFSESLARKLGENPPWRRSFLEQAFNRAGSVDGLIAFYSLLPTPSDAETRLFLERLVRERRYGAAHAIFVGLTPPERLGEIGLLYNARFQYGISNLPFDWVVTPMPNTLTELRRDRNRRLLRVSFFGGRTPFRNVNHLLALTPGSYTFSGTEQALSLNNPRGMRWRIFCTNTPDESLAATPLLVGDIAARPFAVDFKVGPNCLFQNLQLELAYRVALEQEATGSVVYSDLSVAQTSQ